MNNKIFKVIFFFSVIFIFFAAEEVGAYCKTPFPVWGTWPSESQSTSTLFCDSSEDEASYLGRSVVMNTGPAWPMDSDPTTNYSIYSYSGNYPMFTRFTYQCDPGADLCGEDFTEAIDYSACGSSAGGYFDSAPATDLCKPGIIASSVTRAVGLILPDVGNYSYIYYWKCTNPGSTGQDTYCFARENRDPVADAGSNKTVNEGEQVTLNGSASDYFGDTLTYSWSTEVGSFVDSTVLNPVFIAPSVSSNVDNECTLTVTDETGKIDTDQMRVVIYNVPVPGSCGTANGHGYPSISYIDTSAERCATGTFTFFTDNISYWSWGCTGEGGVVTDCSANKVIPGSYHNTIRRDEPSINLCDYGNSTELVLAGDIWYWNCTDNPGEDAGCYTYKTSCGSANGGSFSSLDESTLCKYGNFSDIVIDPTTGNWIWNCVGDDSLAVNCSATKIDEPYSEEDGICGSANKGKFLTAPSTKLCYNGSASEVSGSGPWTWSCSGTGEGVTDYCFANLSANTGECGEPIVDTRDGKTYNTVQIGNQCWFKDNLNVGTMINGSVEQGTSCASIQKYCYDNQEDICSADGGLYQWNQVMCGSTIEASEGICPSGWHVPTHAEWYALENYLTDDGQTCTLTRSGWECATAGQKLTFVGGNASGFSAIYAGYRDSAVGYKDFEYRYLSHDPYGAAFWTSSQVDVDSSRDRTLDPDYVTVGTYSYGHTMDFGFSVRCIKNNNKPVIINGTLDYSVNVSEQVNFTGFSASDPDEDDLTYMWTCSEGTFTDDSVINPTYIAPASPIEDQCILYVYDGKEAVWSDSVTVSVTSNVPSEFTCGDSFIDIRDGQTYSTVQIGDYCWMKENLNYAIENSLCYDDNPTNCDTYGRLYHYNDSLNACPSGWHLSTKEEIDSLFPSDVDITRDLLAVPPAWVGEDMFGFTALPAGGWNILYETNPDAYVNLGSAAYFWEWFSPFSFWFFGSIDVECGYTGISSSPYKVRKYWGPCSSIDVAISARCVKDYNQEPVITNGTLDYSINVSEQVSFTGFSASDPDEDNLVYKWTCSEGSFVDNSVINPTYIAPASPIEDECILYVSDGTEMVWSDSVIVSVTEDSIDGVCAINSGIYSEIPADRCASGTSINENIGLTSYTWECQGTDSSVSCSADRISFKSPLDFDVDNTEESCFFCDYYYDNSGVLRKGSLNTSTGRAQPILGFTVDNTKYINYKIKVGSVETTSWLPINSQSIEYTGLMVGEGVATDTALSDYTLLISYGNGSIGKTYNWYINLEKSGGGETGWISAGTFNTPKKPYPIVRIATASTNVYLNTDVQYCTTTNTLNRNTDTSECFDICWTGEGDTASLTSSDWKCSVCYDSSGNRTLCSLSNSLFSWSLPLTAGSYQSQTDIDSPNPIFKYTSLIGDENPGLAITGSECAAEGETGTTVPLPTWRETN